MRSKNPRFKNAPLCTCSHEIVEHTTHGATRFPVFTQCTKCECNKYRSDGKPRSK